MSRPSNLNSSSWRPLWNNNNSSASVDESGNVKHSRATSPITGVNKRKNSSNTKELTLKSSSTSLSSTAASNWLGWTSRKEIDNPTPTESEHDDEDAGAQANEDDEDYIPDDLGDEIDDHVTQNDRKKSSSSTWNFWNREAASSGNGDNNNNNSNNNNNNNKDSKDTKEIKEKIVSTANTILNSSPSLKQDLQFSTPKVSNSKDKIDSEDSSPPPSKSDEGDDAVLYKPHDNSQQFNQINTHKNENLRENVIVPNWNLCLPAQSSLLSNTAISSIFGNLSTSNQNNAPPSKMDLKNWRQLISQLSSRLGFSSQSLTSVVEGVEPNKDEKIDPVQKEFNLLVERTYKLYGRSLAKLPPHKRACLPNYNKYYSKSDDEDKFKYNQRSQYEEDESDPNAISITNDPMGNLLINHKPRLNAFKDTEVMSYKSGPLQKIKKILIIGVHGFFPTRMIRPLIGAPKGTSLKFANEAEKAVIRYCIENNLVNDQESNVSIQKIALEKEGKIFDRVSFFTDILTKWKSELNDADFIFIASHSQGCVVSIILLAKLIKLGILKDPTKKRIGILAMAGISNGPFYGTDKSFFMKAYSAIEHDSLLELFELTKFTSEQSLVYKESTQIIINANVKICFIGSINDQLVPLYSALASHVFHPNIYRACYIDHSSQTPIFIQKLVSLCCQLQNLGYFDNNVLKELSTSLAGPLTGGGHSKIYNDGKVYDLGVKFVLDTDDIVIPSTSTSTLFSNENNSMKGLVMSGIGTYGSTDTTSGFGNETQIPISNQVFIKEYNVGKIGTNPFLLPWCLRGLLFNIEKNWPNNSKLITVESGNEYGKNGYDEINDLYELFENWKPDSKILKELKFKLNGLRASKL